MRHSILRASSLILLSGLAVLAQDSTTGTAVRLTPRGNTGLPVNLPVIVQKKSAVSSGSVASLQATFDNALGNTSNTIIVSCGVGNSTLPTVTDSLSHTYYKAEGGGGPSVQFRLSIDYASVATAGTPTVTCTNGGANASMAMTIYEVSGLIQTRYKVENLQSGSGTSTSLSTGSFPAMQQNQLAVVAFGVGTAAQTITPSNSSCCPAGSGGGLSNDSGQLDPSSPSGLFSFVSASTLLTGATANLGGFQSFEYSGTATIPSSEPWGAIVATFLPVTMNIGGTVGVWNPSVLPLRVAGTVQQGSSAVSGYQQGILPAKSTAAAPTLTEDRLAFLSLDLKGNARSRIQDGAGNDRAANVNASGELNVSSAVTSFPDNEPFNVAQINGVTPLMGNGATGTGSQRVTPANDSAAIANWGHGAIGAAPPTGGVQIMGPGSGATGGQSQAVTACTEYANVQQTANAQIITGVSGRRIYICALNLVTATAQNVAVVAGTGTVCATNTVAVPGTSGGTTAATGWNFAANGGIVLGAGFGAIAKTTVNADNLCILQSGSGQLSGGMSYAIL